MAGRGVRVAWGGGDIPPATPPRAVRGALLLALVLAARPAGAMTLTEALARARADAPRVAALAAAADAEVAEVRAEVSRGVALRGNHDPEVSSLALGVPVVPRARRAAVDAGAAVARARALAGQGTLLTEVVDAWAELARAQARARRRPPVARPAAPHGEVSSVDAALLGAVVTSNAREAREAARDAIAAAGRLGALLGVPAPGSADGPWELAPPPEADEGSQARLLRAEAAAAAAAARAAPGALGGSEIALGVARTAHGTFGPMASFEVAFGAGGAAHAQAAAARADAAARSRDEGVAAQEVVRARAAAEAADAEALLAEADAPALEAALRAVDAGFAAGELSVAEWLVQRRAVQDALDTVDELRAERLRARAALWAAAGAWPGAPAREGDDGR